MNKTLRITGNLAALLGILVFLYPFIELENFETTLTQKIFISLSVLICSIYFFIELFSGPKKYKTEKEINDYMGSWIKKRGRIVIFTRDMSWVDNPTMKNQLIKKAQSNDLIICQPKINELSTLLKNEGAEIYTYENLNFIPKSRFTFINYSTNSSKVAIGRKDDNHNHIITEFTTKDTIEYYLAEDLVNIIKSLN
ncbi:hypothetical protein [Dokdonia sp. Asnod1-B02]|uniref:hypothetical protein n=1 Tax=Dokdonia sp. Asnod1-B02 TaxID=3160573 RepID=UPI0038690608